jgi:hypothetical protein
VLALNRKLSPPSFAAAAFVDGVLSDDFAFVTATAGRPASP